MFRKYWTGSWNARVLSATLHPVTLELNLLEPQFSQLQNGNAKNIFHRVVKKI